MAGLIFFICIALLVWHRRGPPTIEFRVRAVKFAVLLSLLVALEFTGFLGGLALAPVFVLVCAPSLFIRHAVVPFGLPRFTYWVARCCGPVALLKESSAGAAFYGALAFARRPSLPARLDWLDARVARSAAVGGAGLAAAGLLAALRGDRAHARRLLLVADALGAPFILGSIRVVVRNWLVVDAGRDGRWREVVRLGARGADSRRWSLTTARIGERLLGEPRAYPVWNLWLLWAIGGRWRVTLALLRRALAGAKVREATMAPPPAPVELPSALGGFAHALAGCRDGAALARAVGALEAALDDPATRAHVAQRLLALGARGDADAVLAGFRERLNDQLVPLIEKTPALAHAAVRPPAVERATERVHARLLREIDAQCADYRDRLQQEVALSDLAEWNAWAALRECAERALALAPASEHALFQTLYFPVCNFAVFQHNRQKRLALANEMFAWLLQRAQGDAAAVRLLSDNVRAGLPG